MVDSAAIRETIDGVFEENAASVTLTKTANDGSTTNSTVRVFVKRRFSASDPALSRNSGIQVADAEVLVEASASPEPGDVLDLFGSDHLVRGPVLEVNPLGTRFLWQVMARPI